MRIFWCICILLFFSTGIVNAQVIVNNVQKISSTEGGLPQVLDNNDYFGSALSRIGDLDNNGVTDLVVGVMNDDDGGPDKGAIYILLLNTDYTVKSYNKISSIAGGFSGSIGNYDRFGIAAEAIGDIDGDDITDIAIGANYDSETEYQSGAVWIIFLNGDGSVKFSQKINAQHGNFNRSLPDLASFGSSICSVGDLNGDGINDIAVGAYRDHSISSSKTGSLYILYLNDNGTVKSSNKIAENEGGFTGNLDYEDYFGGQVASLGDLNNDGTVDLAVSAFKDADGGRDKGAVWVLFLNSDGSVQKHQKISSIYGNFKGELEVGDFFGASLASLGDINNDGIIDLAVGADRDNDGGFSRGAVWILYLFADGTVQDHIKISDIEGCFSGYLKNGDYFGGSMAVIDNSTTDEIINLAVGAVLDDDGGENRGTIYIITLDNIKAPNAGIDKYVCEKSVILGANVYSSKFNTNWRVLSGTGQIVEPDNPKTSVINLSSGENTFVWSVNNGTCQIEDSVTIMVEELIASAGKDQRICTDSSFLEASKENNYSGYWKSITGGVFILEPQNPSSRVQHLAPGVNKFVWTINNEFCETSDTISIIYDYGTEILSAGDDVISCKENILLKPSLIPNDVQGTWEVLLGDSELLYEHDKSTEVTDLSEGVNIFSYKINECRSYTIKVTYQPLGIKQFSNVITPNNDNVNDFLIFPNIELYPTSELIIVNRWGKVIYQKIGYANNWKCSNYESGIYFYRITVDDCLDYKSPLHVLK